jgi:hypothetical protein
MEMIQSTRNLFLVTLLIAGLIFIVGLLLGMKYDEFKTDDSELLLIKNSLDTQNYIVESDFFDTFGNKSCSSIEPKFNSLQSDLAELGKKLTEYDAEQIKETDDFTNLKRKYFLQEISTLILKKKLIDKCDSNGMNIIFFYKIDDEESLKQGYALDKLVDLRDNVRVFSFDADFDDSALNTLKIYYNITSYPSVVINFDDIHREFISLSELLNYKQ